jgi:hypothetical protein
VGVKGLDTLKGCINKVVDVNGGGRGIVKWSVGSVGKQGCGMVGWCKGVSDMSGACLD